MLGELIGDQIEHNSSFPDTRASEGRSRKSVGACRT